MAPNGTAIAVNGTAMAARWHYSFVSRYGRYRCRYSAVGNARSVFLTPHYFHSARVECDNTYKYKSNCYIRMNCLIVCRFVTYARIV